MAQGTPPAGPATSADRPQGRNLPPMDPRPTSPPHLTPTFSASSDVNELRQLMAGLQSQNSQLVQTTKQQQVTIARLEVSLL